MPVRQPPWWGDRCLTAPRLYSEASSHPVRLAPSQANSPDKASQEFNLERAWAYPKTPSGEPSAFVFKGNAPPAILALADGTVYVGHSIGAAGSTVGEVVFNTAMTGYQEILTDPSYCQQIVTLTYPHIGNYGVNSEDVEADKVHAAGLVIKDLPLLASNFRQTMTLGDYLVREGTVAIANIDTRKLTRQLRSQGAQNGCIHGLGAGRGGDPGADRQGHCRWRRRRPPWPDWIWPKWSRSRSLCMDPDRVALVPAGPRRQARLWRTHEAEVSCGGVRLWRQKEHFAHVGRAWLQGDRGAGADPCV